MEQLVVIFEISPDSLFCVTTDERYGIAPGDRVECEDTIQTTTM